MNKMNLPPPFEEDAIPGLFSMEQDTTQQNRDLRRKHLKRRRTDESSNAQIVEEDDDDEEEEDQAAVNRSNSQAGEIRPPQPQACQLKKTASNITTKDAKADDKPSDTSGQDNGSRHVLIGKPLARQNKLSSIKKSATLNTAFQRGDDNGNCQEVHRSTRPGVISENEVNRQRLLPEGISCSL